MDTDIGGAAAEVRPHARIKRVQPTRGSSFQSLSQALPQTIRAISSHFNCRSGGQQLKCEACDILRNPKPQIQVPYSAERTLRFRVSGCGINEMIHGNRNQGGQQMTCEACIDAQGASTQSHSSPSKAVHEDMRAWFRGLV